MCRALIGLGCFALLGGAALCVACEDDDSSGGDGGPDNECSLLADEIQAVVDSTRITPNVVVAVRDEECGTSLYRSGDNEETTTDSLFLLASVTKTFVAATVMMLADEGELGPDDRIDEWLDGQQERYWPITIRQLLGHTSGIPNYTEFAGLYPCLENDQDDHVWTPQELVDLTSAMPTVFPPGTDWSYSNTNYILLGMIIEAVTGSTVGEVFRERMIGPVGLEHTFFAPEEEVVGHQAQAYTWGGLPIQSPLEMSCLWTTAGMVCTPSDAIEWMWALVGKRTVIDPALVQEMIDDSEEAVIWGLPMDRYGLGLMQYTPENTSCGVGVGHNGGWDGFTVYLFDFADRGVTVGVFEDALHLPTAEGDDIVLTSVLETLCPLTP